jgi:hypothetical protein
MRLTGKDAVTTAVNGAIIAVDVAFRRRGAIRRSSFARGTTAVSLVLGAVASRRVVRAARSGTFGQNESWLSGVIQVSWG